MKNFYLRCVLLLGSCWAMQAEAGAWVQEKGKGLNIFSVTHYASTQYWTSGGELKGSPLYTKYELGNYLEYGFTERLTMGLYLTALQSHTSSQGIQRGDNDTMVFGRYLLWQAGPRAVSVQLYADYLGHAARFNVPPQSSVINTGEALVLGTSGSFDAQQPTHWFCDASLGLIQRYSDGSQAQVILEGGLKLNDDRLWVFLQSFNTLSLNHTAYPQGINYNLATLQPSLIYWATKTLGGQVGVAQDFYGMNVGRGTAPFAALWLRI